MKKKSIVALAALVALSTSAEATTTKKKKVARQTNPTSHASSTNHSATARRRSKSREVAHRGSPRQLTPTPDRYKEIQKALADRGYLKNEPTGTWDSASQEAMRKFQNDQKLDPSGKITAASLIALGLGSGSEARVAASSGTSPADGARTTTAPE
jgi:peptidoglycan hydrolase-like protein with peptidoglycan-binding domain